jgi:uncharacterized alpha/beta hydrolase family protein
MLPVVNLPTKENKFFPLPIKSLNKNFNLDCPQKVKYFMGAFSLTKYFIKYFCIK